jgi:hypothetical protein
VRNRRRIARIVAGAFALGAMAWPASGQAGSTYGDLALSYTGTTTSWTAYPFRDEQSTYDPCDNPAQLLGMGVYVHESVPTQPAPSTFNLGRAYNVAVYPEDQYAGAPAPDSTHQIADTLSPSPNLVMGEVTVCAADAGSVTYRSRSVVARKRSRTQARVACLPGSQVVSGGVDVAGTRVRGARMVSSAPFDDSDRLSKPEDGWSATVDNPKGANREMVVHAICSDAGGFRYEREEFSVRKQRRKHVETACPGVTYAVGAGVVHSARFRLASVVATHPGGEAFPYTMTVTEVDNLSRKRSRGEAFAICHS